VYAQHAPAPKPPAHDGKEAAEHGAVPTTACTADSVGPQSPRDISDKQGTNRNATFALATRMVDMNLCNVHFHRNAEHKGASFNVRAGPAGFRCNAKLLPPQAAADPALPNGACGGSVKPGDTIEVHWVFTSCATKPGPTLGACSTEQCSKPTLRVESQVFLVTNGVAQSVDTLKFGELGRAVEQNGKWLPAKPLPAGSAVRYRGSTTNPAYDEQTRCSPLNVTWNVRQTCALLDIRSLNAWCNATGSPFRASDGGKLSEIEGHAARALVKRLDLLSKID
jgi:hypothetical protein